MRMNDVPKSGSIAVWRYPGFENDDVGYAFTFDTREHEAGGGGGAGAVTVTTAFPLFPSLVATTLAVPAASAVTTPFGLTEATDGVDVDHTTVLPLRTFPP